MIARIGENLYSISIPNSNKIYVILNNKRIYLINSTNGSSPDLLIHLIFEIKNKIDAEIEYLILTDCTIENAGGGWIIYEVFKPKVVAHYPDSIFLRHGECKAKYKPLPVTLEIRERMYKLSDDILLINCKTPTLGSIMVKYKEYLISGFVGLSPFALNVKYVCDAKECKKVDKIV